MHGFRTPLPRRALLSLLALMGLVLCWLCVTSPQAHATGYGELLRFPGKGSNGKGNELLLGEGETHAFAVNPTTGEVYVGDETEEGSEDLRIQGYSGAGAFASTATIKRPSTLPKGISGFEGYEGFALDPNEDRIYVLANFKRFAEDGIDGNQTAAGALYALNTTPNGAGKLEPAAGTGKEGLLGTTTTLDSDSETPGQALLEPTGLTVDPKTDEILILGTVDDGADGRHTALVHVSSSGSLLSTWTDPATLATANEAPDSPVVSPAGELFFEAGDELLAMPADATSGAPETAFSFAEPEGLQAGPFVTEPVSFGEGETGSGGGLSLAPGASEAEGQLVAFAEIWGMTETGELNEKRNGTLSLHYTEALGHVKVTESGWSGGVEGEGGAEKVKPCEIGFANANPSVAAGPGGSEYVLAPAWSEVIELGPGGGGCPEAKESPEGLEATLDNKRVVNPEVGDPVTLTARVVQGNVLSVKWIFGDGQEADVVTPPGEQTQTAETVHKFLEGGKREVEAIIQTDDLATPELHVKTTLDVVETLGGSPKVTKQPVSQLVLEGQTAKFEAGASGEPAPTVQWEASSDRGQTWTPVSGQTQDTLTLANVTASQNGYLYRASFQNGVGTPVTSASATLDVETKTAHEEKIAAEEKLRRQHEEEEERDRVPVVTPPGPGPGPGPGQGVLGVREAAARATLASTSLTVSKSGVLEVKVQCPAGVKLCSGTLTLSTLGAVSARRAASKHVLTLGSASFTVAGAGVKTIALHLSAAGRSLLAREHTLRARALVLARNAAGEAQSLQTVVTLRAAKSR